MGTFAITFDNDSNSDSYDMFLNSSSGLNSTGNETIVYFSYPFPVQVLMYVMYNLVFVTALVGNSLVLSVVVLLPKMRSVTNLLLANLALSDLLVALLCVPLVYLEFIFQYWPFGRFLCYVLPPMRAVVVLVSAYSLVTLAVERYVAILHPLKPRMRKGQVVYVVAGVWIAAVSTAAPIAVVIDYRIPNDSHTPMCDEYGWSSESQALTYSWILWWLQYFIPMAVLMYTYTQIAFVVWGKENFCFGPRQGTSIHQVEMPGRPNRRKHKAVALTLAVVLGYTIAWLPYNIIYMLPHDPYLYVAFHWLAMSHTTYNPFIYAGVNARFRKAFRDVITKCPLCTCFCSSSGASIESNEIRPGLTARMTSALWKSSSVTVTLAELRNRTRRILISAQKPLKDGNVNNENGCCDIRNGRSGSLPSTTLSSSLSNSRKLDG